MEAKNGDTYRHEIFKGSNFTGDRWSPPTRGVAHLDVDAFVNQ